MSIKQAVSSGPLCAQQRETDGQALPVRRRTPCAVIGFRHTKPGAGTAHHFAEDADSEPHNCGDMMEQVRKLMLDELAADRIVDEVSQAALNH